MSDVESRMSDVGNLVPRFSLGCQMSNVECWMLDGTYKLPYYIAFSNNKKMVTILHRELEHKVEKVQHMKVEVMWLKTKNNMNFQPE